jgi:hypothetical protein
MQRESATDILTLYQDFRASLPGQMLQELRGKSFAAQYHPATGWCILRSDEDDERLAAWLQESKTDLTSIVLDQIPAESVAGGAQLL